MTCATACRCRCGQVGCGCHEDAAPVRRKPATNPCGLCAAPKQRFGTGVELCPECDFGRCPNKDCRKVIRQLSWVACPHCGTRPR
jgi:hypothetical protein